MSFSMNWWNIITTVSCFTDADTCVPPYISVFVRVWCVYIVIRWEIDLYMCHGCLDFYWYINNSRDTRRDGMCVIQSRLVRPSRIFRGCALGSFPGLVRPIENVSQSLLSRPTVIDSQSGVKQTRRRSLPVVVPGSGYDVSKCVTASSVLPVVVLRCVWNVSQSSPGRRSQVWSQTCRSPLPVVVLRSGYKQRVVVLSRQFSGVKRVVVLAFPVVVPGFGHHVS